MKTRVLKTVDKEGGKFYPQHKGWLLWHNFNVSVQGYPCNYCFSTLDEAIAFIINVQNCVPGLPFFPPNPTVVWQS
jgi:hypothetical protein